MLFINKLKHIYVLHKKILCKHIYLFSLGIVILLLNILHFSWVYFILLIFYISLIFYNNKIIGYILLFLFTLIIINVWIRKTLYHHQKIGKAEVVCQVINITITSKTKKVLLKKGIYQYILYDKDFEYQVGDVIKISGILDKADSSHLPYGFDYQNYLENKNIIGIFTEANITYLKNRFTIYKINAFAKNYFQRFFKDDEKGIIEALVIGIKDDIDDNVMKDISSIGISHLFVISGLHMGIVSLIIEKILKLLHIKEKFHFYIIIIAYGLYYILTLFSVSILRVLLVYILAYLNRRKNLNLSNFNIYNVAIILILLINPLLINSMAFLLTFLTSMSLVLVSPLLKMKGLKGFIVNNLLISFNSLIVTIPVVITINPNLNFLSIIYNLFFIPFVTYILLPLCFLTTFFLPFKFLLQIIIRIFIQLIVILSKIDFLTFSIPQSIFLSIVYYLMYINIIVSLLYKKKKIHYPILIIVLSLFIQMNKINFQIDDEVLFFDLPKGESTLFITSFNRCNILIDTGENEGNDLEHFLKKKGIKRIDYCIISHGDSDHNGKLETLITEFTIKKIVISPYDITTKNICQKANYQGKIIQLKANNEIKNKIFHLFVYSPNEKKNSSNNNSLVFKIEIFHTSFLFTGDIEKEVEEELENQYNKIEVDFLKVPHHGSKTSSSNSLKNFVNYRYAICMNGYKNSYGFPNQYIRTSYDERKFLVTSEINTLTLKRSWFERKKRVTSHLLSGVG